MRVPWTVTAGVLGGALVALGLAVYRAAHAPDVRAAAERQIRRELEASATALAATLGPEGVRAPDLAARLERAGRAAGLRFTVVLEGGSGVQPTGPEVAERWFASATIPETRAVVRAVLDDGAADAALGRDTRFPWFAGALAVSVGGVAAALLLAPTAAGVRAVANALRHIQAGDLSPRVPVRGPDFLRGLSSSFNDTAQRLQEDVDRVRAERGRLSTVLDGMVEGVLAIDDSEVVRFVNGAARALLALPAELAPEGRPIQEVIRDPSVLTLVRGALRGGDAGEAEIVWYGSPRTLIQVTAAPVREGGTGAIVLVRDVSTIRRLERMRTDFVANVSHELRTPLASIAGAAETLAEGALEDAEAARGFVLAIQRGTDRLRALVDDLLTLSRLESAPETIERVHVDFALVVRQACEAVERRARDAGLSFDVRVDGGLRVLGDPEALRRLVDNLVVNALTYSPPSAWVRVSASTEDGAAVLVVADGGIGIGPEHLERIFERFYRVDKARSRSKGGTGLGLAIVKHSVALHGGEIYVQSRPGAGSTFTVRIPLSKESERVVPA